MIYLDSERKVVDGSTDEQREIAKRDAKKRGKGEKRTRTAFSTILLANARSISCLCCSRISMKVSSAPFTRQWCSVRWASIMKGSKWSLILRPSVTYTCSKNIAIDIDFPEPTPPYKYIPVGDALVSPYLMAAFAMLFSHLLLLSHAAHLCCHQQLFFRNPGAWAV